MLRVRNPWNTDNYSGPWGDSSSLWTAEYKAQVPYKSNYNDGVFFIDQDSFKTGFYYYQINHVHNDWSHSYYEVVGDTTSELRTISFTLKASQELFVSADFYDYRMYPNGCKSSYTSGSLAVY